MTCRELYSLVDKRIAIYLLNEDGFSHKYEGIVRFEKVVFDGKNLITLKMIDVVRDNKLAMDNKLFSVKQTLKIKKWRIVEE